MIFKTIRRLSAERVNAIVRIGTKGLPMTELEIGFLPKLFNVG